MCNHCSPDPRDAVGQAGDALLGLSILINELPADSSVDVRGLGAILGLIHDRLNPAADKLQDYVPRLPA